METKNKISIETFLIRLYIIIIVFEGVIRYILNLFKIPEALYIKDFILILLIMYGIKQTKFNKKHLILFLIISISFIISIVYVGNFAQIMFFVLKVLTPFLAGILQYNNILADMKNKKLFYIFCFIMTILGVYLNYFVNFPWEGLEYEIGNKTITATRQWSTLGQKRIAGFSRSSINAATQIIILAMLIQVDKKNNRFFKLLCCTLTIGAIALTTTKGIIITSIIFYINDFLNIEKIKKIIIKILIIIMIILPIFSTVCEPIFDFLKENLEYEVYIKYFDSFKARLMGVWPASFELLAKHGNKILGRGLGGIGASQYNFEINLCLPADNMFVYLYVTFGVFSILIYYCIIDFISKISLKNKSDYTNIIYNILLIICSYGIVGNILEESLLCILFGACIGFILKNIGRKKEK